MGLKFLEWSQKYCE